MRCEPVCLSHHGVVAVARDTAAYALGCARFTFFQIATLVVVSILSFGSTAVAAELTWISFPATERFQVEVVDQPLPVFSDSTEACVYAVASMASLNPGSGWQYSNAHYVPLGETDYPGCHHTLTAVGPTAGGYPIGTVLQDYGQNWVIPMPACPDGYSMVGSQDSGWSCGRWSELVDPAKPSQCEAASPAPAPDPTVGNPIACANGKKVERRSDRVFPGFSIDQTFSSMSGSLLSAFGKHWSSFLTA